MTLRTPLCDLLGIEYPIVPSGMGDVAGPELVAEVSRAGGLGILAGLIHDLPGGGEVVQTVVREARAVLASLAKNVRT